MKKNSAIALIIVGAILSLLLALFFCSFGYWTIPGLLFLAVGSAGLLARALADRAKRPLMLTVGLYVCMIALACFAATIGHVTLGLAQISACLLLALGLILIFSGLFAAVKQKPASQDQNLTRE